MAASLSTIKNWFKTGLKPTQAQFWATWDSFWHKDDQIPISSIEGLNMILNAKAEKVQFDTLKQTVKIYALGELQIFKTTADGDNTALEVGDVCIGIVENYLMTGIYQGGDTSLLASFEIITNQEL